MDIYPFFLECSLHYTDDHKISRLESLAFGNTDLIIKRDKNTSILITSRGEFIIPDHYTEALRLKLDELLWNSTDDFYKMKMAIKKSYESWTNVKKKDRLRMIDEYASSTADASILKTAVMFKLITPDVITYENGEIVKMDVDTIKKTMC